MSDDLKKKFREFLDQEVFSSVPTTYAEAVEMQNQLHTVCNVITGRVSNLNGKLPDNLHFYFTHPVISVEDPYEDDSEEESSSEGYYEDLGY